MHPRAIELSYQRTRIIKKQPIEFYNKSRKYKHPRHAEVDKFYHMEPNFFFDESEGAEAPTALY